MQWISGKASANCPMASSVDEVWDGAFHWMSSLEIEFFIRNSPLNSPATTIEIRYWTGAPAPAPARQQLFTGTSWPLLVICFIRTHRVTLRGVIAHSSRDVAVNHHHGAPSAAKNYEIFSVNGCCQDRFLIEVGALGSAGPIVSSPPRTNVMDHYFLVPVPGLDSDWPPRRLLMVSHRRFTRQRSSKYVRTRPLQWNIVGLFMCENKNKHEPLIYRIIS